MFLIGDKVTIKDDLNTSKYLVVNGSMAKLAGREAIITSANIINDGYRIDLDNGQYIWKGYLFEGGHMKAYYNSEGQEAKADAGKLQMMLMLPEINKAVVRVREYGIEKYKEPDNWKIVSKSRWDNAMLRHMMEYIQDPYSRDEESGLRSLSKEQQKDFERAIRVLWANGKINDKEYYDAINEALKSIETHSEGF